MRLWKFATVIVGYHLRMTSMLLSQSAAAKVEWPVVAGDAGGTRYSPLKDGWIEDALEVSVRAVDSKGTIRGSEHFDLNVRIRPESRPILNSTGFRAISKIEVPPGKYRLLIGVREIRGGPLGTIYTDLEVPDFATAPLAMSHMLLTSVNTGGPPTGRAEQLRDRLPVLPSTVRAFKSDDELGMFVEVYDNDTVNVHTIDLTASILDGNKNALVRLREERSKQVALAASEPIRYGVGVPLKDLKPGTYSARIEAASRLDRKMLVAREVLFSIIGPTP